MTIKSNVSRRALIASWRHHHGPLSKHAVAMTLGMAVTALAGAPYAALAQENNGATELDPITVEGEREGGVKVDSSSDPRFTAPLIDTPKSVTIIPEEVLEQRGAQTLEEIFRTTPGISIQAGEGGNASADRPLIRGQDAQSNMYVDGIRDPGSQTRGTFNLEQVEIVKGANSTMGGRGSSGGSINLVTKSAKSTNFIVGEGIGGTDDNLGGSIDANYVLNDLIGARVNLIQRQGDVPGRDEVENKAFGAAGTVTFGMGKPIRGILSYEHYETDDTPDYGVPWISAVAGVADTDRSNFYGLHNRDFKESNSDSGTFRLEYDVNPSLQFSNTTRYAETSLDYLVTKPEYVKEGNVEYVERASRSRGAENRNFTNVTQLNGEFDTGGIGHSFAVGGEFSREIMHNRGYTATADDTADCSAANVGASSGYQCTFLDNPDPNDQWQGTVGKSSSFTEGETETRSIYGFDTIELTEDWLLNLGLRYDWFNVRRVSVGGRGGDFVGEDQSEFLTYQGGVVYKVQPNGSVYVSYATSAEPSGAGNNEGGGDNLSLESSDLEPVTHKTIEFGTKWDLLENALSVNAAVFQTLTTNDRVDVNGVDVSVGESRVRGLELGVAGNITRKWSVFGGYTYLKSDILDDGDDDSNVGNEFVNTPNHSIGLWSTYEVLEGLTLGGGGNYVSARFVNTANSATLPGYFRFDAMARYVLNENFSFKLNANNLTDERYIENAHSTQFANPTPGRSLFLTGTVTF